MNRWLGILFVGTCLSATAISGCGDDSSEDDGEDGGTQQGQGTVNEAATSAMVTTSITALSSATSGDGPGAALALASVGTAAWTVVTPSNGQTQSIPQSDSPFGLARSAACEEQCTIEGEGESGSCTFSGCSIEGSGYAWGIEGTFSWTPTTIVADLAYTGDFQGFVWTINVDADLTYTSTSIDGTVTSDGDYSGNASGQEFAVSWESSVTYNDVVFPEGGGCPTSGSVDVDASVTANGTGYEGSGSVTFPVAGCTG
jgi:hypothetical protein